MVVYATTHLINVAFNCVELKFPFPPSHVRSECVADISRVMLDLRVLRAFPTLHKAERFWSIPDRWKLSLSSVRLARFLTP